MSSTLALIKNRNTNKREKKAFHVTSRFDRFNPQKCTAIRSVLSFFSIPFCLLFANFHVSVLFSNTYLKFRKISIVRIDIEHNKVSGEKQSTYSCRQELGILFADRTSVKIITKDWKFPFRWFKKKAPAIKKYS